MRRRMVAGQVEIDHHQHPGRQQQPVLIARKRRTPLPTAATAELYRNTVWAIQPATTNPSMAMPRMPLRNQSREASSAKATV